VAERTPFYEDAAMAGAAFAEQAGWLVPSHYGHVEAEYHRARSTAALFDISHHGTIEVSGPDAAGFLHNLTTNDVLHLATGAGREAFLTTGQAKIIAYALIDHVLLEGERDAFWLNVGPTSAPRVLTHLDRHLISERVELTDRTAQFGRLHLAGRDARHVMERTVGEHLQNLEPLANCRAIIGGASIHLRRHEPLAVDGYDVVCAASDGPLIWKALTSAAKPAGSRAYEILRMEAGTPVYGVDIDDSNLPQEVGITDRAVSFTKGCYIGQETIARIRTYGHVNRSLVGLRLAGDMPVPHGSKLLQAGKDVGYVTSSIRSISLGAVIGLAYVRRGFQEPGTALEVDLGADKVRAEVVALPFGSPGSANM
jgi:folate-binding protein YgfZ